MELKLTGIDFYNVRVRAIKPYRDKVSVEELDADGCLINLWTEPFDSTGKGDILELQKRFQKRIDTGSPPAEEVELTVSPDVQAKRLVAVVKTESEKLITRATGAIGHIAYEVADGAVNNAAAEMEGLVQDAVGKATDSIVESIEKLQEALAQQTVDALKTTKLVAEAAASHTAELAAKAAVEKYRWKSRVTRFFRRGD